MRDFIVIGKFRAYVVENTKKLYTTAGPTAI